MIRVRPLASNNTRPYRPTNKHRVYLVLPHHHNPNPLEQTMRPFSTKTHQMLFKLVMVYLGLGNGIIL